MSFQFKPAIRENVGLLIGLMGGTGSGKTYTAMRLAAGIAGNKPFAVIDTEAGRALHYADMFRFDHGILRAPFTPDAYADAIHAADAAGYPVIVVDSFSHEHAGEGGILDMHEHELDRMAGDDWKKRESCKMAAWIKPKMQHKAMVQKLLQVRAHLILCFRAEEKVEMTRDDRGKMVIQPKLSPTGLNGWSPVCEKNLPYELTCSFLLLADAPGVPRPIKLQEQHRPLFPADKAIAEASGQEISKWASGGAQKPAVSLNDVLVAIAAAPDETALKLCGELAGKLTTAADKNAARDAYKARRESIEAASRQPAATDHPILTYAQVADRIQHAGDVETLAAHAADIDLVADAGQRQQLTDMYRALRANLEN